jgi:hypothetical protein
MRLETVSKIIWTIILIPVYMAFGLIWLGVMPALMYGMIKALVITILKMI